MLVSGGKVDIIKVGGGNLDILPKSGGKLDICRNNNNRISKPLLVETKPAQPTKSMDNPI